MATELFSNNARGVLAQAVTDEDEELILDSPDTSFEWPGEDEMGEMRFQRATLFHPSNPKEFEIVFIVGRSYDGVTFSVERGEEGTRTTNWPVGTVIEARVTAGMLESFVQDRSEDGEPGPEPVVNLGQEYRDQSGEYLFLEKYQVVPSTRGTRQIGEDFDSPVMVTGRPSISRTLNLSIGTIRSWSSGQFNEGGVFSIQGIPGFQFTVESKSSGWLGFFTAPDMSGFNPNYPEPVSVETNDDRTFIIPSAYPVNSEVRLGVQGVITDLGFICVSEPGPVTTTPKITVTGETGNGPITLVDGAEIIGANHKTVHKFTIQNESMKIVDRLTFSVDRSADKEIIGFFYWVVLPFKL